MELFKTAVFQAILVAALLLFLVNEVAEQIVLDKDSQSYFIRWAHYLKSQLKNQAQKFWMTTRKWKIKGPKAKWKRHGPWSAKRKRVKGSRMLCIAFVAFTASITQAQVQQPSAPIFDSDSRPLYVDNCASRSISSWIEDFVDPPKPIKRKLEGVASTTHGLSIGTIKWTIEDDNGAPHEFLLPNSIYAPQVKKRLLSPQHLAQVKKDHKPNNRGTWCATYEDAIVLHWDQCKYKRTIPLDKDGNNVGVIQTASGYRKMAAFCAQCTPEVDLKAYSTELKEDEEHLSD